MSNYNNNNQQGGQGQSNNSASYDNHAEIEIIGNLSTIKDPDSGNRVHAFSKPMQGAAKVANAMLAVNHPNKEDGDFWKLEVWAQTPDRASMHNFLMDHCEKGRKVFVKGTPILNRDSNGQIWPTIRVTKLIGLGNNGGGNNNNQQQEQQQGQPQGQQQGFGGQQQGFGGQPQGQQQGFGGQQQGGFQQQGQQGFSGQQQGGFSNPNGQQGGFGAPNGQQQGGFNPNGQQGGFGAPGQGAPGGFGAPNGQQGGFGGPGQQGGFGR